jgi:hypothetical protein
MRVWMMLRTMMKTTRRMMKKIEVWFTPGLCYHQPIPPRRSSTLRAKSPERHHRRPHTLTRKPAVTTVPTSPPRPSPTPAHRESGSGSMMIRPVTSTLARFAPPRIMPRHTITRRGSTISSSPPQRIRSSHMGSHMAPTPAMVFMATYQVEAPPDRRDIRRPSARFLRHCNGDGHFIMSAFLSPLFFGHDQDDSWIIIRPPLFSSSFLSFLSCYHYFLCSDISIRICIFTPSIDPHFIRPFLAFLLIRFQSSTFHVCLSLGLKYHTATHYFRHIL